MLEVQKSNARRWDEEDASEQPVYIPPELCTIAGLTNQQVDNRVKINSVQSIQLTPLQRVDHLNIFLRQIQEHNTAKEFQIDGVITMDGNLEQWILI